MRKKSGSEKKYRKWDEKNKGKNDAKRSYDG